jgi:hypothetical protein
MAKTEEEIEIEVAGLMGWILTPEMPRDPLFIIAVNARYNQEITSSNRDKDLQKAFDAGRNSAVTYDEFRTIYP